MADDERLEDEDSVDVDHDDDLSDEDNSDGAVDAEDTSAEIDDLDADGDEDEADIDAVVALSAAAAIRSLVGSTTTVMVMSSVPFDASVTVTTKVSLP